MSECRSKLVNCVENKTQVDWEEDSITEQIWSDLKDVVTHSTIQEVLKEVIPRYEEARIQTFVPIFIRRDAIDRLRSMQMPLASPVLSEANARPESQTRSGLESISTASDDQDTTKVDGLIHGKQAT